MDFCQKVRATGATLALRAARLPRDLRRLLLELGLALHRLGYFAFALATLFFILVFILLAVALALSLAMIAARRSMNWSQKPGLAPLSFIFCSFSMDHPQTL